MCLSKTVAISAGEEGKNTVPGDDINFLTNMENRKKISAFNLLNRKGGVCLSSFAVEMNKADSVPKRLKIPNLKHQIPNKFQISNQ